MISRLTHYALKIFGELVKAARRDRAFSQAELALRLQVTRQTVGAIEKGDPKVAVGTVFEAAYLLGIPLFSHDKQQLSKWQTILGEFNAVLPQRTRSKKLKVSNEF